MSTRATRGKKTTTTPRTPKTTSRGRGAARKTPAQTARTPRSTPKTNVTDLCLEILRKLKATPSSCESPLPGSLTQEEKHEWIQTYINSITPNRVDYKKSPINDAIITKLPRNSILDVKEDPKLKKLMEKFKEPYAKILERVDYEKESTEGDGETETAQTQVNPDVVAEEIEPADEINDIVPSMSYEEFLKKQEEQPSTSNANFEDPTPGTSKQDGVEEVPVEGETSQGSSLPGDAFVTLRTPHKKRQTDVIEIGEDSDLDDSVQIVKVIPPKRRRAIRLQKETEVIELDESTEKEPETTRKDGAAAAGGGGDELDRGLGECPICFETLEQKKGITATHCGHIYCTPCIRSSLKEKKSCPKCRKHLNNKKIHPLYL